MLVNLVHQAVAQLAIEFTKEPENVTVMEMSDLTIPCLANTTLLPAWIIDGREYGSDVGLPTNFLLNGSDLLAPNIALALNGTVVQCFFAIFLPSTGVVRTFSKVGVITVIRSKYSISPVLTITFLYTNLSKVNL